MCASRVVITEEGALGRCKGVKVGRAMVEHVTSLVLIGKCRKCEYVNCKGCLTETERSTGCSSCIAANTKVSGEHITIADRDAT